jgi:hypothetical protein
VWLNCRRVVRGTGVSPTWVHRVQGVCTFCCPHPQLIPIAEPKFTKNAVDDPLLQVPPASRGNLPYTVPPACRGNQAHRFPLPAGGTLRRGFSSTRVFVRYAEAIGITSSPSHRVGEGRRCSRSWELVSCQIRCDGSLGCIQYACGKNAQTSAAAIRRARMVVSNPMGFCRVRTTLFSHRRDSK